MKSRVLIISLTLLLLFAQAAEAAVLGDVSGSGITDMGAYTYFYNTVYNSDRGPQTEYYVEYTPNAEAVPVVVNGEAIWGKRNINEAVNYMEKNNMRPLIGVNADYFSFQTGIPMGHTIIDGEIASADISGQDAVGFRADGSGFIGWLDIETRLSNGENEIGIDFINKWCQAGFDAVYLITDKFGISTRTVSECVFVICTPEKGKLGIGKELKLTVDDVMTYDGSLEIPEGKMILLADTHTNAGQLEFLKSLKKGQELTITNVAADDDRWNDVENGLSSVGGRLLNNGEIGSGFEAGTAPRTAVGIKPDGNIIFYVLDGRQPEHSVGSAIVTLAERMKELGCVDALNLDGGGSTTIAGIFPGSDTAAVANSPSEGELRSVANFIFLKDSRMPTGTPWIINADMPANGKYLSGMTARINVNSVYDTHNYRMDKFKPVYSVENSESSNIEADKNGNITIAGSGNAKVTLSIGSAAKEVYLESVETPDDIKIYNSSDSREIAEIYTEANEELQLDLTAAAFLNGERIAASDELFKWEIEGDIGKITPDGLFTLADDVNKKGKIKVSVGGFTKEINVEIADYPKPVNPFADTVGHWAEETLSMLAYGGVIKGSEENGVLCFRPDSDMTRAEFASMLTNFLHTDLSEMSGETPIFTDKNDIPEWARKSVQAMSEAGIIQGRKNSDGTYSFAPNDRITRAEAMTVLSRIISSGNVSEVSFADSNLIPDWARDGVAVLVNAGVVNGYEDNTIRPNANVKRAEAAVMLSKLG